LVESIPESIPYRQRRLPQRGAFRVHPDPGALPHLTHSGPGRNRYDDPLNAYGVRYVAENLTGALLETMARFRAVPTVQSRLAAVIGVEDDDPSYSQMDAIRDWLAMQRVGLVTLADPRALVDVHDPLLLADINKHYQVVAALEASELGTALNPATLDEGVIRLGGPRARPITQAVSRAMYEGYRDVVGGIAYRSRLDDQEWCWALWDDTDVIVVDEPLTPLRRHHRQAVQHAATALEIQLPLNWQ